MKKLWLSILLALCIVFCMAPLTVFAEGSGDEAADNFIDIPVIKQWDDTGNEDKRPESITVNLLANGSVEDSISLNADNGWTGVFLNKPLRDNGGNEIIYTITEEPVTNYTPGYTEPVKEDLTAGEWGDKITPASNAAYPFSGNIVVANKGGNYYIWTMYGLTEAEKGEVLASVNAADLPGFGKALTPDITAFAAGLPASFDDDAVTITQTENGTQISFGETSVWSLFYAGMLSGGGMVDWIITNTYTPSGEDPMDPPEEDPLLPPVEDPPEPAIVTISAVKTLDGTEPEGSDFTFLLKDEAGDTLQQVNNMNGVIDFEPLTFTEAGNYIFTVTEQAGDNSSINYDPAVYTVRIQIGLSDSGFWHEAGYQKDNVPYYDEIIFANTTKEPVPENNDDPGNKPKDQKPDEQKPDEQKPDSSIKVTPKTGDSDNMYLWLAVLLISGGALAGIYVSVKNKNRNC